MIGNDVVDLLDPDADHSTYRPRFDARVFTPQERSRIAASPEPPRERWCLWAAKEASYKLARKQDARSIFSPPRFVVELSSTPETAPDGRRVRRGRVRGPAGEHHVSLEEGVRFVHAIATTPLHAAPPIACVEQLAAGQASRSPDAASRAVRALARRELAWQLGLPEAELEIASLGRVPCLRYAGRPLAIDLSLSHHGDFVAFACSFEQRVELPGDVAVVSATGAAS